MREWPDGKDKTFQADGEAKIVLDENFKETYLTKFPEKQGEFLDDIFFILTPNWWRYTEWGTAHGKITHDSVG
jgi:hypothetical protein